MPRRWFKLIWYFWPGLVSLMISVAALAWFAVPQPRDKAVLKPPPDLPHVSREQTIRTKDNRYVASFFSGAVVPTGVSQILTLFDSTTDEQLFRIDGSIGQISFDPLQSLIFVFRPDQNHEQLIRFDPQTKMRQVLWEYHLPATKFAQLQLIATISCKQNRCLTQWNWSLLSPDGSTWIIPRFDERMFWYERIDVSSGKVPARLSLPDMPIGTAKTKVTAMGFIGAGDLLWVKTRSSSDNNDQYRLHWLETRSGQELSSTAIPFDFDAMCYADNDLFVARSYQPTPNGEKKEEVCVVRRTTNQVLSFQLDEIDSELHKLPQKTWPQYSVPREYLSLHVDPVSQTLTAGWTYHQSEPSRSPSTFSMSDIIPKFYFSVRDLRSGELLRCDDLYYASGAITVEPFQQTSLQSVFPGPTLFVSQSNWFPEDRLETWIEEVRQWLGLKSEPFKHTHWIIDGKTGKVLWKLRFPIQVWNAAISQDQSKLILSSYGEEESLIYDFPLHKPWLLILSWSFGIAGGMTLLVEARHWWKRRGLASSNRQLQHA
jgi:hypothetical protein